MEECERSLTGCKKEALWLADTILGGKYYCDEHKKLKEDNICIRDFKRIGLNEIEEVENQIDQQNQEMYKMIFDQLDKCNYECEGGPLRLNIAYIELKKLLLK